MILWFFDGKNPFKMKSTSKNPKKRNPSDPPMVTFVFLPVCSSDGSHPECCNLYPQLNQLWKRSAQERVIKMLSVHASSVFSITVWVKKDVTTRLNPSTSNDCRLGSFVLLPLRKKKIGHICIVPRHICLVVCPGLSVVTHPKDGWGTTPAVFGYLWLEMWMSKFLCWTFQV